MNHMDAKFEKLYRDVFADLTVDREESAELIDFFTKANPPPDKLVWLRAAAFRIGCEFLQEDDKESDIALIRCINVLVHILESTCMKPKTPYGDTESLGDDYQSKFEELYRSVFSDLTVDREESKELISFFQEMKLPSTKLVWARATVFKIGCDFLSENDKASNVSVLRCINVLVHYLEQAYLEPKPFVLKVEPPKTISVKSIGLNASIEKAVQHLWDLDVNRLTPNEDYKINVQRGKKPYHAGDGAREPLFTWVDRNALRRPTYRAFIALLDNYEAKTGVAEVITSQERTEVKTFLNAIMQTGPMQFCHKYCAANSKDVSSSPTEFKKLLQNIWFDLYKRSRNGRADSSGFEHVFTGEIKNGEVSGFHNWIQFYLEEKRGKLDYYGYIKPRSRSSANTDDDDYILTVQFMWHEVMKKVGTMFLGVSPEFEMALYTLCFLMENEQNKLDLKTGDEVFGMNIKCFQMARGKIGTSFPEMLSHYEE